MEFIENRFGLRLTDSSPFVRAPFGNFPLHLVEPLDVGQRLFGNLALVAGVQVEEFSARMRHATRFGHAAGDRGLVARVVVADECAAPGVEKFLGMLAGPAVGEIVDDGLDRLEGADAV